MIKIIDFERAKKMIIVRLKRDKDLHTRGLFDQMGEKYDDFDENFPRGHSELMIAWNFWDAWMMERSQGFSQAYAKISKDDWPVLAQHIITQLENNLKITDARVLANFDFTEKPTAWEKIKAWILNLFQQFFQKNGESKAV